MPGSSGGVPSLQICRRYHCNDTLIERIVPAPALSLEYQEGITHTLRQCRPLLEPIADVDALLALLEHDLAIPVGITSRGATADDKRLTATASSTWMEQRHHL